MTLPLTVYGVECPRCGAYIGEPCWHLTRVGEPNQWPHRERVQACRDANRSEGK